MELVALGVVSRLRRMSDLELAWAAGFFDGEGCTCVARVYPSERSRGRPSVLRLTIGQKEVTTLQRFQAAIGGLGSITGPYSFKNGTPYRFTASSRDTEIILPRLWPYLSEPKKQQALRAVDDANAERPARLRRVILVT